MRKVVMRRAIAVSVATLFILMGAISMADAGRVGGGGFKGGGAHMGGGAKFRGGGTAFRSGGGGGAKFHTNQGGKFAYRGGGSAKFHTNQGGKYAYRGSGQKFHTNPGGKYRWSGKYDNHYRYGHRRYGYNAWYGLPLYSYGSGCGYLYRRAVETGSTYWWDRYRRCTGVY